MSLHNQLGLCTEKGQLEPYQAMQSYAAVQPRNNPCLVSDTLPSLSIMLIFFLLFLVVTRFGFKEG